MKKKKALDTSCSKCKSSISVKLYPYAHDIETNEIVYAARCFNCGTILYLRN